MGNKNPTSQMSNSSNSITSGASSDAAILECLAELKLLSAANNDAVALAQIISQMEALVKSSNDQIDSLKGLCDKLLKQIEQDAQSGAEKLDALKNIKDLLTCPPATSRGVLTTW